MPICVSHWYISSSIFGPLTLDLNREQFKKFIFTLHQTDYRDYAMIITMMLVSSAGEMLISKLLTWHHLFNNIFLILCNAYSGCSLVVPRWIYLVERCWSLHNHGWWQLFNGTSKSSILSKILWCWSLHNHGWESFSFSWWSSVFERSYASPCASH